MSNFFFGLVLLPIHVEILQNKYRFENNKTAQNLSKLNVY